MFGHHVLSATVLADASNSTNTTHSGINYDALLAIHPIALGVIFTTINWGFTTVGAAACFLFVCFSKASNQFYTTVLELLFGLGGGIMLAASFFSLLAPAVELAEKQYAEYVAVLPVFGGFTIGILFFMAFDIAMDYLNDYVERKKAEYDRELQMLKEKERSSVQPMIESSLELKEQTDLVVSKSVDDTSTITDEKVVETARCDTVEVEIQIEKPTVERSWKNRLSELFIQFRRSFLLMFSMTIHNLPEGIVVGVAFGSVSGDSSTGISISNAVSLSIGVGIQNIPEGLSVSLPLMRDGAGPIKSFLMGSASALVEILGGLIGSGLVSLSQSVLPYALSFASACMIFVVVNELIPETITKHEHFGSNNGSDKTVADLEGNVPTVAVKKKSRFYKLTSRLGVAGFFAGFIIMMILDIIL